MGIRILAPGPSLSGYAPGDFDGLIIGVNRAAVAFACDVWVCLDWTSASGQAGVLAIGRDVIGSPMLATTRASIESQSRHGFVWRGPQLALGDLFPKPRRWTIPIGACARASGGAGAGEIKIPADPEPPTPPEGFLLYSMGAAMVLAARCGAKAVEIFGCDWAGGDGFDAADRGEDRTPARWARERGVIEQKIGPWLNERGVEWRRVGAR